MPGRYRGILLCEDVETERFIRRILDMKYGAGRFRVIRPPSPQRDGAADAWIKKRYAEQVRYARRLPSESRGLVVVIDGDRFGRAQRLREFDAILSIAGAEVRRPSDKIVVFVPCWSIETWEFWLCGTRSLDESTAYKESPSFLQAVRRGEVSARRAAEEFLRQPTDAEAEEEKQRLPSLAAARTELDQRFR